MRIKIKKTNIYVGLKHSRVILVAIMVMALLTPTLSLANTVIQQKFTSPEAAVKAVVKVLQSKDINTLEVIFGPDSRDLFISGDPIADQAGYVHFLK